LIRWRVRPENTAAIRLFGPRAADADFASLRGGNGRAKRRENGGSGQDRHAHGLISPDHLVCARTRINNACAARQFLYFVVRQRRRGCRCLAAILGQSGMQEHKWSQADAPQAAVTRLKYESSFVAG
jgi:hypothetical protein